MNLNKRSSRDVHEIHQNEHSEEYNARRVFLVGGQKLDLTLNEDKFINAVKEGLKTIEIKQESNNTPIEFNVPEIKLPEFKVIEIEKQVFIPQIETKIVEVPKIINEIKVIEVEKPVITEIIKTIEIEKPVIVEKIQEKVSTVTIAIITLQTSVICGLIWSIITKKWGF